MGLRFDRPYDVILTGNYDFDVQYHAGSSPQISAGGTVVGIGDKQLPNSLTLTAGAGIQASASTARNGTATVTAGGLVSAEGAIAGFRFDKPYDVILTGNYVFDIATAVAQFGVVSISGGGQVQANGNPNLVGGAATITTGAGGPTASIQKNAIGGYLINIHGDVLVTGVPFKAAFAAVQISGGGQVIADGAAGTHVQITGGGTIAASGEKGATVPTLEDARVGAGGIVSASGTAFVPAAVANVTGGGTVTASGTAGPAARGGLSILGGGTVNTTVLKLAAGLAAVSIGAGLTAAVTKDTTASISIGAGGTIAAGSGVAAVVGEIELQGVFDDQLELIGKVRQ